MENESPSWLRYTIGIMLIAAPSAALLFGEAHFSYAHGMMYGMGLVLLITGGKSEAEKNGYNF